MDEFTYEVNNNGMTMVSRRRFKSFAEAAEAARLFLVAIYEAEGWTPTVRVFKVEPPHVG